MAMLFHFASDYFPQFLLYGLATAQAAWLQAIVGLALAIILILLFGVDLQHGPVKKPVIEVAR